MTEKSCLARLRHELRWASVVLAGTLLPLLAVLVTGHTLAWRDSSQLMAPMRSLISQALHEGRLPLWNPYEATGMPLFAQMLHGVLHPWSVLAAFLAPGNGIDLIIVLNVATGALGAGVLARALGTSRTGAVVAGFGYGLSGYLLGLASNTQYLAAGATAPWALAALRRAGRGSLSALALGAVAVAVLHLAGDPQWTVVAVLIGGVLAWDAGGRVGVVRAAAAVAAGSALAGIQLVPAWSFLHSSSRGAGLSLEDTYQWALAPARIVEFLVPGFFAGRPGLNVAPVFSWLGGESAYPLPFLPSVFVGLPTLTLAVTAVRTSRVTKLLAGCSILFLWLSLGHYAGATGALGWVPVWGSFRYAEKLVGPFTLCVTVLAGLGLEPFVATVLRRAARPALFAGAGSALLALLIALAVHLSSAPATLPTGVWQPLGESLAAGFALAAFALFVAAGLAFRLQRGERPLLMAEGGWVVAVLFATGLAGSLAALHAGRLDSRAPMPLVELKAPGEVPRVITPVKNVSLPIERGFDEFDAFQAVQSRAGAVPYADPSGVDNFSVYTGLLPRRYNDLLDAARGLEEGRWLFYRRFAVTHAVITPPLSPIDERSAKAAVAGARLIRTDPAWQISTWEVPHRPWAAFAGKVTMAANEHDAVDAVIRGAGSDDGGTVLLGAQPLGLSPGKVLAVERGPERVRIEAASSGEGLLVVADAFWDGWDCTIDGREVPIQLADGLVRAVRWPAGHHVLVMRYRPPEAATGALLSGVTAVILVAIVAWERRRKKERTA